MITSNKGTKITPILTSFIFQKMYLGKITMIQNFPLLVHQFFGKMQYGIDFILEIQGFQWFFYILVWHVVIVLFFKKYYIELPCD